MNAISPSPTFFGSAFASGLTAEKIVRAVFTALRASALALLYPVALADAGWVRLITAPIGTALAHARAAWLHRWCRVIRRVLGIRLERRGFAPVSGILVANHNSVLDAILVASVRPCVFVVGAEVRRRPIIGMLMQLSGALFVESARLSDVPRINFMIQRTVQRRLLVVIFPECGDSDNGTLRAFTSTLFQPAVELGCTLTAAATRHRDGRAVIAFSSPKFRRGNRKELARHLWHEIDSQNRTFAGNV